MSHQQITSAIYDQIATAIRGRSITASNVVAIATQCMVLVQTYPMLSGSEKKQIVLTVLHKLVDEAKLPESDASTIHVLIDTVVSSAIDAIKDAFKHKINLDSPASCLKSCWAWLGCKNRRSNNTL